MVPPTDITVKLHTVEGEVDGDNFQQNRIPIRVFNRDFVDKNVFPFGGGDLPFIIVLGKESTAKKRKVQELKEAMATREDELTRAKRTERVASKGLDNYCKEQAKIIKKELHGPSSGYNYYTLGRYKEDAQKMVSNGRYTHLLDTTIRDDLRHQFREEIKQPVNKVSFSLPSLDNLASDAASILNTTVINSVLDTLKNDPSLGEWTRVGLELFRASEKTVCLFCEQEMPEERLAALEGHFNDAFEKFVQRVKTLVESIETVKNHIDIISLPDRANFYGDLKNDYDEAKSNLENALTSLREYVAELIKVLENKEASPFKKLGLNVVTPEIDIDAITRLNQVIQRHNEISNNFENRRAEVEKRLANDMIAKGGEQYSYFVNTEDEATAEVTALEEDIRNLSARIERLDAEIQERLDPDELNQELKNYFGRNDLKLEIRDGGYQIMYGDKPADSLSEGEKTALALLYFLKSLRDDRFDLSQGVVVLDDPVSSLDSDALHLAYAFIRERTQDAAQLFVLTHNFAFFRLVRNWYKYLRGQQQRDMERRPARFYMLERVFNTTARRSVIQPLDPLLEKFESEYQYLFSRVYKAAQKQIRIPLQEAFIISNVSRRLLEAFLAFRYPSINREFREKMEHVNFDGVRKTRIIDFLNIHSHIDVIEEPTQGPLVYGESRLVLNDIIDLMRSEDQKHFEAMENVILARVAG